MNYYIHLLYQLQNLLGIDAFFFVFISSMQRGQNTDSGSISREASFEGISKYVYLASHSTKSSGNL